tara:strand:+ start:18920 stop:19255 length:336 start_codon:yes stop_codon:yes gene_type:complete
MSELKKIYVATGPGDAHVLRGLLEAAGVRVVIRGDDFVPLQGGSLFHVETRPSVWVLQDENFLRAREIADNYANDLRDETDSSDQQWECSDCHEAIEQQFSHCWKCGQSRS